MRRFLGVILGVMFCFLSFSQTPEGFSYQAVLRNSSGQVLANQSVSLRVNLISNNGTTTYYTETHNLTTTSQGIVNLIIGEGADRVGTISQVPWENDQIKIRVEFKADQDINYTELGTQSLKAVPYALHAANTKEISSNPSATDDDPIFVVRNKEGKIVFAVYQDGVRVYVDDSGIKGAKGGFAVGGLSTQGKSEVEYLRITSDSARIYIDTSSIKGAKGGFAVGGLSTQGKVIPYELLRVTKDSTRVYIADQTTKGAKGGFAVGGLSTQGKVTATQFLNITPNNYFIGHESGQNTLSYDGSDHGKYNVFLGYQTGKENLSGLKNVFIGYKTALANTHGMTNVFIGSESGYNNTLGYDNVFIGSSSGFSNTEGINNVFLGSKSGYQNSIGEDNVFVGFESGYNNTLGIRNTFIGNKSGRANIDGNDNIFIGELAGYLNENGSENIFIGKRAGHMTQNSQENTFIGSYSGQQTTMGTGNTFLGHRTGLGNTKGSQNTYIGALAVNRDSVSSNNVALGFNAGGWSHGGNNVYIGVGAGLNTVGDSNVFIGYNAGFNDTSSSCLYIANTPYDSSLVLVYGKFNDNWLRINNKLGLGRNPTNFALEVNGDAYKTNGTSEWNTPSDKRIKTNIQDIENAFDILLRLRPVRFKFSDEWRKKHPEIKDHFYYNYIAQEYQQVFPESVQGSGEHLEGDNHEVLIMNSQNAEIITVKAVQELILQNQIQQKEIEELKSELNAIKALLKK